MITYIYILVDPRDQAIRYVGKTVDLKARYSRHVTCSEDDYKGRWIKLLLGLGLKPTLQVVDEVVEGWEARERWWIEHLRREGYRLTNTCDGGEGVLGRVVSKATRKKLRESNRGQVPCEVLRKHIAEYNRSDLSKPYQREHGRTLVLYRKGKYKPHTDDQKRKVSETLRKRLANLTPEQKKARVQATLKARGF